MQPMTSKTFTIELNEEQKELFDKWLVEVERDLEAKLKNIKSLRQSTSNVARSVEKKSEMSVEVNRSQSNSISNKTLQAIQQLGGSATSVQVIDWLIQIDASLKGKTRRFITKSVTSKLSFLVDKGRLKKEVVDGMNVYSLKKSDLQLL